jgi:hypothetical protein
VARDRQGAKADAAPRRWERAARGSVWDEPEFRVTLLDVQRELPRSSEEREEGDAPPEMGPAAQLEYLEKKEGAQPERFWVFRNFPGFDPAHRRQSRFTFELTGLTPRYSATLSVSRQPGLPWFAGGAGFLLVTLFISLFHSHNRYWFVWTPGQVVLTAWSTRPLLFEPRFVRLAASFKSRLTKAERKAAEGAGG